MTLSEHPGFLQIQPPGPFSLHHTFECGQCFRFVPHPKDGYHGVAFGKYLHIWQRNDSLFLSCTRSEFESTWLRFLDLTRNYHDIELLLSCDPLLEQAVQFGRGLHILAQDPWETLCSFILSQCCNIPRIRSMIDTLCRLFGEPFSACGTDCFAFPSPQRLALCTPDDLAPVRAGYRAKYLISAAQSVCSGFDLLRLQTLSTQDAREQLMSLPGVGRKVADCVLLFGLQKLDAFPVDTWMKKAQSLWPSGFPQHLFGETAGIAQQYIFHYVRSQNSPKKAAK